MWFTCRDFSWPSCINNPISNKSKLLFLLDLPSVCRCIWMCTMHIYSQFIWHQSCMSFIFSWRCVVRCVWLCRSRSKRHAATFLVCKDLCNLTKQSCSTANHMIGNKRYIWSQCTIVSTHRTKIHGVSLVGWCSLCNLHPPNESHLLALMPVWTDIKQFKNITFT